MDSVTRRRINVEAERHLSEAARFERRADYWYGLLLQTDCAGMLAVIETRAEDLIAGVVAELRSEHELQSKALNAKLDAFAAQLIELHSEQRKLVAEQQLLGATLRVISRRPPQPSPAPATSTTPTQQRSGNGVIHK